MTQGEGMRPGVCRRRPPGGVVAFATRLTKYPLVFIIFLVAGIACRRSAFKHLVHMADRTIHRYMFAG